VEVLVILVCIFMILTLLGKSAEILLGRNKPKEIKVKFDRKDSRVLVLMKSFFVTIWSTMRLLQFAVKFLFVYILDSFKQREYSDIPK